MKKRIVSVPATLPLPAILFVLLLLNFSMAAADPEKLSDGAVQQIRALEQEKASRTPASRKLDSQFVFKLKQDRGQVVAQGVTHLQPDIKFEADGRVLVDIDADVTESLLAQIKKSGGTIVNSFPRFHSIRALIALNQLESLAGLAEVKTIRRARQAHTNTGSVNSEGDIAHRANTARRTFSVTGSGIKVGVLSDSIDYLNSAQASGDVGDVAILPGQGGYGSGEGTAMLEIIHDLAPGAQLYFATAFNGEASFAQNILDLRSNGCDIIVDDVGYFDEPPFQDGIIAQAVNTVTADGALYFSAAGNDGNLKDQTSCTWEGDFVDGGQAFPPVNIGGGVVHSFGPANFDTVMSAGDGVDLFWADPMGASTNDYDLFVLDQTGSYVVASSLNTQDGTQDPYENVSSVSSGNRIVIVKSFGGPRFLHLVTSRGALSIKTDGAIVGHSAATAAFSVAAVNALDSFPSPFSGGSLNPVETFSSDGPRRVFFNADGTPFTPGNFSSTGGIVRQKPDIAAADGVATLVFGQFFGTSAAAPHAAAIAALLWSYNRTLTPGELRTLLTGTALDIEGSGADINSGAGIVMAHQALQSLPPRPVMIAGNPVLVNESCPNGVVDPGETVTVALSLTNAGVAGTINLTATLLGTGGVMAPSAPQNYGALAAGGGTASKLFTFIASGNCGETNIATVQLEDGTNNLGAFSFAFPLGLHKVALSENFDGVTPPALPSGWTVSSTGLGSAWLTTSNASDTQPNSLFVPDPNGTSDKSLISPSLHINTSAARLTFQQSFNVESDYDRGELEISIAGGAFTDIIVSGGSFVTGGYNGFGWTGNSGGFITTMVDLPPAAAGQNVKLRWHFTSDSSVGYDGWYIDSILLTDGFSCCGTIPNNLVVSISDSPDPVVVGGPITYTINVQNTGPNLATGVNLSEVLPAGFTLGSINVSQGIYPGPQSQGGGTLNFSLGTLFAGSTATITIGGTADSVGLMTNRVSVTRIGLDANTNDNSAQAVTVVILPSVSVNGVSLFERNSGVTNAVFTVTLSPPPFQTATIDFATSNRTAIAGNDYTATSGTLIFAAGVSNRTISVPIIGDVFNEPDETFEVNLFNPSNALIAASPGIGTILNDDPLPTLSVSDATVLKPYLMTTSAVFNVRLSVPSGQPVTVSYSTVDGTAIAGSDYVLLNDQLTFDPGETSKTVAVTVSDHTTVKPSQTFYFHLDYADFAKLPHNPGLGTIITALPGHADHFAWNAIPSPQSNGVPFAVSVSALDYANRAATDFNDAVTLSGSWIGTFRTNTFFGDIPYAVNGPSLATYGYSFTPTVDMIVTHVRHYSGTKVSLWTDAGVLLASQNVVSVPGTWIETPLSTPVQLSAGQTYRLGFYAGANVAYGRFDQTSSYPDATINQAYYTDGDAFPTTLDTARYAFVDIRYKVGLPVPLLINPGVSGNFTNGLWSGGVTVHLPATNVTLLADDGVGHSGRSLPFNVAPTPGQITHFAWSNIASPRSNGLPFTVSITAKDYFEGTATNFTDTVMLTASGTIGNVVSNILGSPVATYSYNNGAFTFGYTFTPNRNMTVTHVRHHFGSKVSIWTDGGALLATRNVTSVPGTWVETPLNTPLQLVAGTPYRVAVYSANQTYYWRDDMAATFAYGTIDQGYYSPGDVFPTGADSSKWFFVDLKYTFPTNGSLTISPTQSANFAGGTWSGNLTVFQAATNATLLASNTLGDYGQSNPFNVSQARGQVTHFTWSPIASPESNGLPFMATLTARDYLNDPATNFTGAVAFSGSGISQFTSKTMFDNIAPANTFNSGNSYTMGYAFTPSVNMMVTHLRHYFGTKVSIWTDAGVLLVSQNVTSVPGTWTETKLSAPVQLLAGQTYRIGAYTTNDYSWRTDQSSFFSDGIINQGFETGGDAFPNVTDAVRWWLVDIRYTVPTVISLPIAPASSANFADGIWSGYLVVLQAATNVTLLADDGFRHFGQSLPFDVMGTSSPILSLGDFGMVSNRFEIHITGSFNQVVVVDASTNLLDWAPVATNTLGVGPLLFADPAADLPMRFYRVRLQ